MQPLFVILLANPKRYGCVEPNVDHRDAKGFNGWLPVLIGFSYRAGALLPPYQAGSYISPYLPLVYRESEHQRLEKSALTFDDFIPLAIDILEANPNAYHRWNGSLSDRMATV